MDKIGIIYNPLAGSNKKHASRRLAHLKNILGNRGILRETRSMQELDEVAKEFHEQNVDILAISGGDGTNHKVLTAFYKIYENKTLPMLALLRGGTMNLLECSLGMRGNPEARLTKLIKATDNGKYPVISHTLLCVNGKFGYIFGNGLIANFMEEYYGTGKPCLRQAVATFAKAFWTALAGKKAEQGLFAPIYAHVQVGDSMLPQKDFTALMAATEKECGLGFKPFYRARQEQGKFHFLALNLEPKEMLRNLPRFRTGKQIASDSFYTDVVTNSVQIETFKPYHYTIDGEMLNSTRFISLSSGPVVKIVAV